MGRAAREGVEKDKVSDDGKAMEPEDIPARSQAGGHEGESNKK